MGEGVPAANGLMHRQRVYWQQSFFAGHSQSYLRHLITEAKTEQHRNIANEMATIWRKIADEVSWGSQLICLLLLPLGHVLLGQAKYCLVFIIVSGARYNPSALGKRLYFSGFDTTKAPMPDES
jgi:hypothetical protein